MNCRFFEIESSGQEDELRIHYSHDRHHYISTFRYRLADNKWHKLAVTLSGNHVTLYVDCLKFYEKIIQTVDRVPLPSSNIQLFVGQRNRQHALFRVSIGVVYNMKMYHVKRVGFLFSKTKIWSFFQRMKFINFFDTSYLGVRFQKSIHALSHKVLYLFYIDHPTLSAIWDFIIKAVICGGGKSLLSLKMLFNLLTTSSCRSYWNSLF